MKIERLTQIVLVIVGLFNLAINDLAAIDMCSLIAGSSRGARALAESGRGSFSSAMAKTRTAIPFNYPTAEIPILGECSHESI